MSDNINLIKGQLSEKLRKKEYRDAFVSEMVGSTIAAQIHALRESRHCTQEELARLAGMAQARISVLENPEYDGYSIKTLERLATALDAGLIVKFATLDEVIDWTMTAADAVGHIPGLSDQLSALNNNSQLAAYSSYLTGQETAKAITCDSSQYTTACSTFGCTSGKSRREKEKITAPTADQRRDAAIAA